MPLRFIFGDDVMGRIDGQAVEGIQDFAAQGINLHEAISFIAKQFNSIETVVVRRADFQSIATNAEGAMLKLIIIAPVVNVDQVV